MLHNFRKENVTGSCDKKHILFLSEFSHQFMLSLFYEALMIKLLCIVTTIPTWFIGTIQDCIMTSLRKESWLHSVYHTRLITIIFKWQVPKLQCTRYFPFNQAYKWLWRHNRKLCARYHTVTMMQLLTWHIWVSVFFYH